MTWTVYILRCADGTLYTGSTTDLAHRLHAHNSLSSGAKYTRSRRPVTVVYSEKHPTASSAKRREAEIKCLTRKEKEHLVLNQTKKPSRQKLMARPAHIVSEHSKTPKQNIKPQS